MLVSLRIVMNDSGLTQGVEHETPLFLFFNVSFRIQLRKKYKKHSLLELF